MSTTNNVQKDACDLATQVANRYGKLAMTRAAGEAAAAARKGDHEKSALWDNVVACLRLAHRQQGLTPAVVA